MISVNDRAISSLLEMMEMIRGKVEKGTVLRYVSFIRSDILNPFDRLSCDWCGLWNGLVEMVIREDLHIDDADFRIFMKKNNVQTYNKYFEIDNAVDAKDYFLKLRDFIEKIERSYCPFGYMKKVSYDRNYYNIQVSDIEDIRKISQILEESGINDCTRCIPAINKNIRGVEETYEQKSVLWNLRKKIIEIVEK